MKSKRIRTYLKTLLFVALLVQGLISCKTEEVIVDNLPNISDYPIVGTNQSTAYNNSTVITVPSVGSDFYGQNANYLGNKPSYTDNGDGTVTDNVTGLMWQNSLDHNGDGSIDYSDKLTYDEILALPNTCTTGGHTDWRVPTIKEQYSLIMFSGKDISGYEGTDTTGLTPFINTKYFGFNYGDTGAGERMIDVQCASTNVFVGSTMQMVFGVNFADGRIKGYGSTMMGQAKKFNYLLVRGNKNYGINKFTDNGDGTITDSATKLMWMQEDSKVGMNWKDALSYAENMTYGGHSDWRLPSAKELQSLVDYTRSPQTTNSAAIDPLFKCTSIKNEAGETDYAYYWSGTTHASMTVGAEGGWGAYVAFGRAMGNESDPSTGTNTGNTTGTFPPSTNGSTGGTTPPPPTGTTDGTTPPPTGGDTTTGTTTVIWTDVHGAGAQRSDPKDGKASDYPTGNGPQGDAIRILNYVRLVRNI